MGKVKDKSLGLLKAMILPLSLYLILLILIPSRVGNWNAINIMLILSVVPTIAGFGMSFGFISGIMDFSVGSRIMLAGMCGVVGAEMFGIVGLIVFSVVASVILAAITGGLFWLLKIPSLVVSLGLLMLYEAFGFYFMQFADKFFPNISTGYYVKMSESLTFIGKSPTNLIILAVVGVLFFFVYYRTTFSNQARVVGSDEIIARNIGINPMRVKFNTFVVGGVFLGIAAVVSACYSGAVGTLTNMASMSAVFKPMMAIVIGMILTRFVIFPVGIFIGALSINIIFSGIIALGWSDDLQKVVLGFFLIIIVGFTAVKSDLQKYINRLKIKREQNLKNKLESNGG